MKICLISYSVYEYDNRVHRYGESLLERGDDVDVLCLGMHDDTEKVADFNGAILYKIQKREIDERGPISYLLKIMRFYGKAFYWVTRCWDFLYGECQTFRSTYHPGYSRFGTGVLHAEVRS